MQEDGGHMHHGFIDQVDQICEVLVFGICNSLHLYLAFDKTYLEEYKVFLVDLCVTLNLCVCNSA